MAFFDHPRGPGSVYEVCKVDTELEAWVQLSSRIPETGWEGGETAGATGLGPQGGLLGPRWQPCPAPSALALHPLCPSGLPCHLAPLVGLGRPPSPSRPLTDLLPSDPGLRGRQQPRRPADLGPGTHLPDASLHPRHWPSALGRVSSVFGLCHSAPLLRPPRTKPPQGTWAQAGAFPGLGLPFPTPKPGDQATAQLEEPSPGEAE